MSAPRNYKRLVLTGAVTAITIAGSLYGAGIKTGQEAGQVRICGREEQNRKPPRK